MAELYHSSPARRLKLFHCDRHHFPLPEGHKFPLAKYRLLREQLQRDGLFDLTQSSPATREQVVRVHDAAYADAFLNGNLPPGIMRRIGFPWSSELVVRTLASAGSTLRATRTALARGISGTLAGGTHHAFRSEGSGFCVFNDLAIAIAELRANHGVARIAVVDLDVHQGDGTAAIFAADPRVFTLSIHGKKNFPFRKQLSTLDVELEDGCEDDAYLRKLQPALKQVWEFQPEFILYQAGVDGLRSDRLGRLGLTPAGLSRRDEMVMEAAKERAIPLAITIGGGYSDPVELTVEAHAGTFRMASQIYGR